MKGKKILYLVSDIEKSLCIEWTLVRLVSLCDLHVALIGSASSPMAAFLRLHNMQHYLVDSQRFPHVVLRWMKVFAIVLKLRPNIVHTHLWQANLIGLSAAWLLGVKQRIYTRHHAIIHYNEYPSGLKWDKLCNWLATDIIAISERQKSILLDWDRAQRQKVSIIHTGFDLSYYCSVEKSRVEGVRRVHAIPENAFPIVGIIARYFRNKGIQYVIPAFRKLRSEFPEAHLILANACGNYEREIHEMLKDLPAFSYTEIVFEQDVAALFQLFSIYVHAPVDLNYEAFGQTYVEAMASGIPSVVTLSGVAPEFVIDGENALVVDYCDTDSIFLAVKHVITDAALKNKLTANGIESVRQFDVDRMVTKLTALYG